MPRVEDIEEITDRVLSLLIGDPNFLSEWERRTIETVSAAKETKPPVPVEPRRDRLSEAAAELSRTVDSASQLFLDAEYSLFRYTDNTVNRDARDLHDLELRLERLDTLPPTTSTANILEGFIGRVQRMAGKKFPCRISSSCHVGHVLKFASSLCGMLFRIHDHLLSKGSNPEVAQELHRSATDFNRIVVEKLITWQDQLAASAAAAASKTPSPAPRTPKRRPLSQVQQKQRSPGFLMSPELVLARQRLQKSRSTSSLVAKPRGTPPVPSRTPPALTKGRVSGGFRFRRAPVERRDLAVGMERKWGRLLAADHFLRESIPSGEEREDSHTRVARKITAQVISELRKTLGSEPTTVMIDTL